MPLSKPQTLTTSDALNQHNLPFVRRVELQDTFFVGIPQECMCETMNTRRLAYPRHALKSPNQRVSPLHATAGCHAACDGTSGVQR